MTGLPQTKHLLTQITIPSTQEKFEFRQFLAAEEKILLTAQQAGGSDDVLRAIEQIIVNCGIDPTFDVGKLTTFDFDYVFIKLRAISVGNTIEIKYTDGEEQYDIVVDLDAVTVDNIDIPRNIVTGDGVTIALKYPTMKKMIELIENPADTSMDFLDTLLLECIDKIYSSEEVYDDYTPEQLIEWIGKQTPETFAAIRKFLTNLPDVTSTTTYKTKAGEDKQLVLRGIDDFFTFR